MTQGICAFVLKPKFPSFLCVCVCVFQTKIIIRDIRYTLYNWLLPYGSLIIKIFYFS